jgi:hypothetical protein
MAGRGAYIEPTHRDTNVKEDKAEQPHNEGEESDLQIC